MINRRYGGQITNELSGREYKQEIPFGQLLVNYYLDISEEEYVDQTYKTNIVVNEDTQETMVANPTFIGYPYRAMH